MREGKTVHEGAIPRVSPVPVGGDPGGDSLARWGGSAHGARLRLISSSSAQLSYSNESYNNESYNNEAILTSVLLGISKESAEDALRNMRRFKDDAH